MSGRSARFGRHVALPAHQTRVRSSRSHATRSRRSAMRSTCRYDSGSKMVYASGLVAHTTQNVWSVYRTMFKEAVASRDKSLRLRVDDPTVGHKPPLKTPKRQKTFIYPSEFAKLLACEDVPRVWREVYAVAAYTYVRPEELQAIAWPDVDFDARTVHVSEAVSARTGKPKPLPKTRKRSSSRANRAGSLSTPRALCTRGRRPTTHQSCRCSVSSATGSARSNFESTYSKQV